jgi:hypothetical protein
MGSLCAQEFNKVRNIQIAKMIWYSQGSTWGNRTFEAR